MPINRRPRPYSDYYKKKTRTPGSFDDEEDQDMEETIIPRTKKSPVAKALRTKNVDEKEDELKKDALKRRLKILKGGKTSSTTAKPGLKLRR